VTAGLAAAGEEDRDAGQHADGAGGGWSLPSRDLVSRSGPGLAFTRRPGPLLWVRFPTVRDGTRRRL
jgi:hypothetical protein